MEKIDLELLKQIADLEEMPEGSYNIRKNGKALARNSTTDIEIVPKTEKSGIDIIVKAGVKGKSCHIPVILTEANMTDVVYNDFYIGKDADVTIVAGCGIACNGKTKTAHNGIHRFYLEEGARVKYIEKHLGIGDNTAERVLDPVTEIYQKKDSSFEMLTTQIKGVFSAVRKTIAKLDEGAKLVIREKIMTDGNEKVVTKFKVYLNGNGSSTDVISRSVAKGKSRQHFISEVLGNAECFGHVECDGIIVDKARISSDPKISANNVNSSLVHEAAIGKIAGEQIVKLMSLGLNEEEAEQLIIKGFLS